MCWAGGRKQACPGNLRKLKKIPLFGIFCFAPTQPFQCKCFWWHNCLSWGSCHSISFLSASLKSHPTPHFTRVTVGSKRWNVACHLLEVEHVGVVVVLHGDGGVAGGVHDGKEEAWAWRESGRDCQLGKAGIDRNTTKRSRAAPAVTATNAGFPLYCGWCRAAQKCSKCENCFGGNTWLVNWCQEFSSCCTLITMPTIFPVVRHVMKRPLHSKAFLATDNYNLPQWWVRNLIVYTQGPVFRSHYCFRVHTVAVTLFSHPIIIKLCTIIKGIFCWKMRKMRMRRSDKRKLISGLVIGHRRMILHWSCSWKNVS